MNNMPQALKDELNADPAYNHETARCARRSEGTCYGRMTWEHAWTYANKEIQRKWNIVPLCWYHHLGAGLNKFFNRLFAINQATKEDLAEFNKIDWVKEKRRLEYELKA